MTAKDPSEAKKTLFQITYESTATCIRIIAELAKIIHEKCSNARECKRYIRELNDTVWSLIARAKSAPQLAYTWSPSLLIVNEFSRLGTSQSLELSYKVYKEDTKDLERILYNISSTEYGYALHLGVIALALEKAIRLGVIKVKISDEENDKECENNCTYSYVKRILDMVNNNYREILFERELLRIIEYTSRIIPALLEPLADEIDVKLRDIREVEDIGKVKEVTTYYKNSLSELASSSK